MDKDSFDAAMKLNHGRTVKEREHIMLKEDDWVRIKNISTKGILVVPIPPLIKEKSILPFSIQRKISGRLFSFYNFLINFEHFDPNGK